MINILIPLAGDRAFEVSAENVFPRLFTRIDDETLLEHSLKPFLELNDKKIIIVTLEKWDKKYKLTNVFREISKDIEVICLSGQPRGAAITSLMAIDSFSSEDPLVVFSCEQVLDLNLGSCINFFGKNNVDAGVLTFGSIHPNFAYIKSSDDYAVQQVSEKNVISSNAITGFYYFKLGKLFIDAAKNVIRHNASLNGEFYISETLNDLILNNFNVKSVPISTSSFFHILDSQSLEKYSSFVREKSSLDQKEIYSVCYALETKNVDLLSTFLGEELTLQIQSRCYKNRQEAEYELKSFFQLDESLKIEPKNIIVDKLTAAVEFAGQLGEKKFEGIAMLSWNSSAKIDRIFLLSRSNSAGDR